MKNLNRLTSRQTPEKTNRNVRILRIIRTIKTNVPDSADHWPASELDNSGIIREQLGFDFRTRKDTANQTGSFCSSEVHRYSRLCYQSENDNLGKAGNRPRSAEKLSEIRAKMASGFYNSPEFVDKLADKLIDELYLRNQ